MNDPIKVLENKRDELLNQLQGIEISIQVLKGVQSEPINNSNTKSPAKKGQDDVKSMNPNELIVTIFKREQRFLHKREIAKFMNDLRPENSYEHYFDRLVNQLRALKSKETITNIQIGTSQTNSFWGSPNWLDENGNILPDFNPSPEVLSERTQKKLEI